MPINEVQSQLQSIEALVNRIENVADPALEGNCERAGAVADGASWRGH